MMLSYRHLFVSNTDSLNLCVLDKIWEYCLVKHSFLRPPHLPLQTECTRRQTLSQKLARRMLLQGSTWEEASRPGWPEVEPWCCCNEVLSRCPDEFCTSPLISPRGRLAWQEGSPGEALPTGPGLRAAFQQPGAHPPLFKGDGVGTGVSQCLALCIMVCVAFKNMNPYSISHRACLHLGVNSPDLLIVVNTLVKQK